MDVPTIPVPSALIFGLMSPSSRSPHTRREPGTEQAPRPTALSEGARGAPGWWLASAQAQALRRVHSDEGGRGQAGTSSDDANWHPPASLGQGGGPSLGCSRVLGCRQGEAAAGVRARQGCEGHRAMAALVSLCTSLTGTEGSWSFVQFKLKNCLF